MRNKSRGGIEGGEWGGVVLRNARSLVGHWRQHQEWDRSQYAGLREESADMGHEKYGAKNARLRDTGQSTERKKLGKSPRAKQQQEDVKKRKIEWAENRRQHYSVYHELLQVEEGK